MAWFLLVLAGVLEVGWALGLKYTEGFTKPIPTILTILSISASVWLLGIAVRTLPVGTAYAVWTGIGTVGTVVASIWFLGEPVNAIRLVCIALIVGGIAGLKVFA